MNENIDRSANDPDDAEALRRAERIKAIRSAINSGESVQKPPPENTPAPVQNTASEWENELAERIARHVQKVKQNKSSAAEKILDEVQPHETEQPLSAQEQLREALFSSNDNIAPEIAEDAGNTVDTDKNDNIEPAEMPAEDVKTPPLTHEAAAAEVLKNMAREAEDTDEPPAEMPKKNKKKKKKKTFTQRMIGLLPRKGDSVLEKLRKVVFLGSIAAIIICGYLVTDYYYELWYSKKFNNEIMSDYWDDVGSRSEKPNPTYYNDGEEKPVYHLLNGADRLLEQNSDIVGVIKIPDTSVNNPVLKASDNEEYLSKKLNGTENRAGELFMDFRNHFDEVDEDFHPTCENSDNLIIYGHNMADEQMFGCLKYYVWYNDYYSEHPIIYLNSNYNEYTYKIFAFFVIDAEDDSETAFDCWNYINFDDEQSFYDFVNEAKRRTIRLNNVDVKYGDKLLTLSTCNTTLGDRGRLIILARLVRPDEDPYAGTKDSTENPNVKWPNLYYDYASGDTKRYDPDAEFVPYN